MTTRPTLLAKAKGGFMFEVMNAKYISFSLNQDGLNLDTKST